MSGPAANASLLAPLLPVLKQAESAVLAFSGGVDSSFLLAAMKLSGIRMLAVTAASETVPENDVREAVAFASGQGVPHRVIRTDELQNESFASNPPNRCFHCKNELFMRLRSLAEQEGFEQVFDGSNADDLHDYRPGRDAAGLHGVRSPLAECGYTKQKIRTASRELGLPTWDRPASPCLSSRFPYGSRITLIALERVAKSEAFLRELGFRDLRVRDHGETARIEVSEADLCRLVATGIRERVSETLKSFGYRFVSMDLEGYRSGSMNRVLGA